MIHKRTNNAERAKEKITPSSTALEDNNPAIEDENACNESCEFLLNYILEICLGAVSYIYLIPRASQTRSQVL